VKQILTGSTFVFLNYDNNYFPLLGICDLLTDPNPQSPANSAAAVLFKNNPSVYKMKIREQAAKYIPET
jgi:hypothetical protein